MKKNNRINLVMRFAKESMRYFLVVLFASFASTILNSLIPKIFSFTIDSVLRKDGIGFLKSHLWILSLFVIVIALFNGIAVYLYRTYTAKAGECFAKNMRDMLFYHIQRLPMSWQNENQTGDMIQRCTADVEVIRSFVVNQVLEVFRTVFLVVISFAMMMSMNVKLSLMALLFVPIIILYSAVFYHLIAKNFTKADEAEGELSTVVQENATGVRVVRAFGREQFEIDRFDEKNQEYASLWIRLGTLSGLYWGIGDLITGLQVIFIIVMGTIEAVHGQITPGEFVAFASYHTTLVWPIRGLGRILSEMSKAGVSFDRVNYILDAEEEEMEAGEEYPKKKDIVFSHVTFGYEDGQNVLQDVSFHMAEGKTYGILGGTGSGKSTLVHLLDHLYEIEEGTISIGGTDLKEIPKQWLRRQIGLVLQEPYLFSRTIGENIAAACPGAGMEEIRNAARIACMDEDIMEFPDQYETMVGERGVTLSGGQRQRIAIARMLLSKAPIVVFDDSLSAVDADTDYQIRQALKKNLSEATVILISHRVTTLMDADEILVLHHGQVKERGTHHDLIHQEGIYKQIYEIQMSQDDRTLLEGGEEDGTSVISL